MSISSSPSSTTLSYDEKEELDIISDLKNINKYDIEYNNNIEKEREKEKLKLKNNINIINSIYSSSSSLDTNDVKLDIDQDEDINELDFNEFISTKTSELTESQKEKLIKYFGISADELKFFRKYKKVMRWLGLNSLQLKNAVESHKRNSIINNNIDAAINRLNELSNTSHNSKSYDNNQYLRIPKQPDTSAGSNFSRRSLSRNNRKNYFDDDAETRIVRSRSKLESYFGLNKENEAFIRFTAMVEKIADVLGELPSSDELLRLQKESTSKTIDLKLEAWNQEKLAAAEIKKKEMIQFNQRRRAASDPESFTHAEEISYTPTSPTHKKKLEKQLGLSAGSLEYFEKYSKGGAPDDFSIETEQLLKQGQSDIDAIHMAAVSVIKQQTPKQNSITPSIGAKELIPESDLDVKPSPSFNLRESGVRSLIRQMTSDPQGTIDKASESNLSPEILKTRNLWKKALVLLVHLDSSHETSSSPELDIKLIDDLVNSGSFDSYIDNRNMTQAISILASLESENEAIPIVPTSNGSIELNTAAESLVDFLVPLSLSHRGSFSSANPFGINLKRNSIPAAHSSHRNSSSNIDKMVAYSDFLKVKEELEDLKRLNCMQKGDVLIKIDSANKSARRRFFQVSLDSQMLSWGDESTKKISTSINISDVVSIEYGPTLEDVELPELCSRWRYFTLICKDRSYDLCTVEDSQISTWFLGLQRLLTNNNGKLISKNKLTWLRLNYKLQNPFKN